MPGNSVSITWNDQNEHFIDLTSWRKIKRQFGHSIVLYPAEFKGELCKAISKVRWLQECNLTVRVVRTADLYEKEWKEILQNPQAWYRESASYSFNDLLRLQAVYNNKPRSNLRDRALSKVQEVMLRRFGMRKAPTLVMRVPHGALRFSSQVHKALSTVIHSLPFHNEVKASLLNNFRIAHTRRATISDMLINSRKQAKTFDKNLEPMCLLDCKTNDHALLTGEDFGGVAKHILTQYARDIPAFTNIDSKYELHAALISASSLLF